MANMAAKEQPLRSSPGILESHGSDLRHHLRRNTRDVIMSRAVHISHPRQSQGAAGKLKLALAATKGYDRRIEHLKESMEKSTSLFLAGKPDGTNAMQER